jgi:hypothetical protein
VVSSVTRPLPRDVPGYDDARARGAVPQVPTEAPAVTVRPTAQRALRDTLLIGTAVVIAVVAVVLVGGSGGNLPWPAAGAMLTVAAAGTACVGVAVRRWGRSQVAELQRGYTTNPFSAGRFWVGTPRDCPVPFAWVGWKWDATWVMRPDGSVVSAPSDRGDPPGLYPSPRREGSFELWTGQQWSGYLPD